jgi:hypothetical protein
MWIRQAHQPPVEREHEEKKKYLRDLRALRGKKSSLKTPTPTPSTTANY